MTVHAHARSTDPQMSHDAARTVNPLTSQERVMAASRHPRFAHGFTREEMSLALGCNTSRVRTAINELVRRGVLVDTADVRRTQSGRWATVVVHADAIREEGAAA